MKPLSAYVKENYTKVFKYASIHSCRRMLVQDDALAVFDEESNDFIGLLTPKDVIERPHVLIADCLKQRPFVQEEWPVNQALNLMLEQNVTVLAVTTSANMLKGLLYKSDLLKAVWDKKEHLANALTQTRHKLEEVSANSAILLEAQSNMDDLQLLVSPDGHIIFHNREVNRYMLNHLQRPLSASDKIDFLFGEQLGLDAAAFRRVFNKALAGEPAEIETEGATSTGTNEVVSKNYKIVCRPVWLKKEMKGIAITVMDITLQKTKDKLLIEQKSALKTVLFTESHIIRRPLANILAILDLLDFEALSNHNAEMLQLLKVSAEELDESIKNSTQIIHSTYSKLQ